MDRYAAIIHNQTYCSLLQTVQRNKFNNETTEISFSAKWGALCKIAAEKRNAPNFYQQAAVPSAIFDHASKICILCYPQQGWFTSVPPHHHRAGHLFGSYNNSTLWRGLAQHLLNTVVRILFRISVDDVGSRFGWSLEAEKSLSKAGHMQCMWLCLAFCCILCQLQCDLRCINVNIRVS